MDIPLVHQQRITSWEVLPTEGTNITSPSVGSLVPVQIARATVCAGTKPAPKNIMLHDLEEGCASDTLYLFCASDLLYYIAHSRPDISYSTIWLALSPGSKLPLFRKFCNLEENWRQKNKGAGLIWGELIIYTWTIFCVRNKQVSHKLEL
jgi:hypothetical protein